VHSGDVTLDGPSQTLPTLYHIYSDPARYAADFRDITAGNNGFIQQRPEFFQSLLADNSRRIRRSISGDADNHSNEANGTPLLKPLLYPRRR